MSRSTGRSRSEGTPAPGDGVTVHGWTLLAHPCFLDQLERLVAAVEREAERNPDRFQRSADFKVLSSIAALAFDLIPQDPTCKEYRHGGTLGGGRRNWFRAKFGNGRFRLFFRFRSDARIIVFAWVNDAETLRTYGSDSDAYAVFARKLDSGNPPDDWDALVADARGVEAQARVAAAGRKIEAVRKRAKE